MFASAEEEPDTASTAQSAQPPWQRMLGLATWLRGYRLGDVRADLVAGLTVGVILIPQSMGYAMLGGLPPIYGLYASLVPLVIYALLGTVRQLAAGIVALDMLIVAAAMSRLDIQSPQQAVVVALTLALIVGAIHLAIGTLRLGFIAEFISRPVIVGFVTAAPILIGLSQIDDLLGMPPVDSHHVVSLVAGVSDGITRINPVAAAIGLSCTAGLVLLRRLSRRIPSALVALVAGGTVVAMLGLTGRVDTIGAVATGFPPEALPSFDPQLLRSLLPTALTLVLIQLVTVVSMGKTMAPIGGGFQPNREIASLGLSNLLGSMMGSPPVSSSFSRTAVNVQAGARSQAANAFAAVLVAVSMIFLVDVMAYLPRAALAAVIMSAAFGLVDFGETRRIFQLRKAEGYLAVSTFAATLLVGIEEGVLTGIGASMFLMLYRASRPHVAELGHDPQSNTLRELGRASSAVPIDGVLVLRVDGSLSFASAEFARRKVLDRVEAEDDTVRAVVIDARGVNDVDTTAINALHELLDTLEDQGVRLYMTHVKGPVRDLIARADIDQRLSNATLHQRNREVLAELAAAGLATAKQVMPSLDDPLTVERHPHGVDYVFEPHHNDAVYFEDDDDDEPEPRTDHGVLVRIESVADDPPCREDRVTRPLDAVARRGI